MKIQITNTEKLCVALDHVNGAANAHTASAWDVVQQATAAEAHLDALGIPKRDRSGAVRDFVSGEAVSNAYSKKNWSGRAATRVLAMPADVETAIDLALTVFCAGFSVQSAPAATAGGK